VDWKLELVAVPVSDVDRAQAFYTEKVGFSADHAHPVSHDMRIVLLTPPGSACSIAFGQGIVTSTPGSVQGLQLVVADIAAAHAELVERGVEGARSRTSRGDRSSSSATPTATAGPSSSSRRGHSRRNTVTTRP
jgi:catechol 2,3-dioxygenase-like lactoylglutathione lyase family enzyme